MFCAKCAVVADCGGDVAPSDGVVVAGFEVGVIIIAIENRNVQPIFGRNFEVDFAVDVIKRKFAINV